MVRKQTVKVAIEIPLNIMPKKKKKKTKCLAWKVSIDSKPNPAYINACLQKNI